MRWIREVKPDPARGRLLRQAIVITLLGNIVLAVSKGIVASRTGSVAIYADAANSVSDVAYSLLMILGLWMAQRPPDLSHPQGHSRFEPFVGLVITITMAFAGYEAARATVERFIAGGTSVELGMPALILVFSALVKTGMFAVIRRISRKVSSPALAATAQDNLTDVITSGTAFLGVLGSNLIHPLFDPIGGLIVTIWIFRMVFNTGRENLGYLTGAGADEDLRNRIVDVAQSVPGVLRVHHTMTEYVGPRLVVDLHINVDGKMQLNDVHAITDEVTARIEDLKEVDRVYVHVEPDGWE